MHPKPFARRWAAALMAAVLAAALPLAGHAQFDPARAYKQSEAVKKRYPDPPVRFETPGFAPGKADFTSHEEMMHFLHGLQRKAPGNLQLRVIGESEQWRGVLTQATQVAPNETTVLLLGESGTGKEVVARFLHRASPRAHGPFVALNCAALPEQLLEAELFGYERGAFTGAVQSKPGQLEQAAGGTLFLDEIGEMSLAAQAKFLRVLQEREFQRLGGTRTVKADIRVVAATNRDLRAAVARGTFREDLYYRLNVFEIRLPPLRERREDILPLSEAFLKEIAKAFGRPPAGIARDARDVLVAYEWPGNVRELRNILERAAILCEGGLITRDHLTVTASEPPSRADADRPADGPPPADTTDLRVIERTTIERALVDARHNKSLAAKRLGLTRKQLYVRLRQHGLQ